MYEIHLKEIEASTLEEFNGPLDLLVDRAREHKIDILKIRMIRIINDFIEYIEKANEFNLDLTTDFLSMASYLLLLKSRLLLPKTEEEEEEAMSEVRDLMSMIEKYEVIKNAAKDLLEYAQVQDKIHFRFDRSPDDYVNVKRFFTDELDPYILTQKIIKIIENMAPEYDAMRVARQKFNIIDKVRELFEYFKKNEYSEFSDLVKDEEEVEMLTVFFAILVLVKRQFLSFTQRKNFGPIYLRSKIESKDELSKEEYEQIEY